MKFPSAKAGEKAKSLKDKAKSFAGKLPEIKLPFFVAMGRSSGRTGDNEGQITTGKTDPEHGTSDPRGTNAQQENQTESQESKKEPHEVLQEQPEEKRVFFRRFLDTIEPSKLLLENQALKNRVSSLEKQLEQEKDLCKHLEENLRKNLEETNIREKNTSLILIAASCAFAAFSALFLLL